MQWAIATTTARGRHTCFSVWGSSWSTPRHSRSRRRGRGPITYVGQEAIQRDIANFKAALTSQGLDTGYLNSVAPGSCARFGNDYCENDEEPIYACADAMREEYQAVIDAGLTLQRDDPAIAENWDQIVPEPSVDDYKKYAARRDCQVRSFRGSGKT
jgi:methionine synthase II (cobalamin-independent)